MTEITIISLISLITLGAIAFIFGRNRRPDGSEEPIVVGSGDCSTCSGNDPKCEQVCTMEAATKPIAVSGLGNAVWVAMDFADVIVHIFLPELRSFYDIEHLWADADLQSIPNLD